MKTKKPFKTQEIEAIIQKGVTLVDFNASWCPPCRAQEPIIQSLANKFNKFVNILILNVDDNRHFAASQGITSIPTLVLYKDGREIQRFVGVQQFGVLSNAIIEVLK